MHTPKPPQAAFKRQIVFRISTEEWPLLQAAAAEHGSIQAAIIAGLRALSRAPAASIRASTPPQVPPPANAQPEPAPTTLRPAEPEIQAGDQDDEICASEAAKILGLKTSTVSGYIRRGRLPGRYDGEPTWRGWLITRRAVNDYLNHRDRR